MLLNEDAMTISLLKCVIKEPAVFFMTENHLDAALEVLRHVKFDLIISDVFEGPSPITVKTFISKLRTFNGKIPVVAFTAQNNIGDEEAIRAMGFDAYFVKGNVDLLGDYIKKVLST